MNNEINFKELNKQPEYLNYLEKGKYPILPEQKYYIDIPWIIANRKAAPLTIGQGLMFNCDNDDTQDWIEEWYEKNYVYSKLFQNELANSLYGRSVMYLLKTETGDLTIDVAPIGSNVRIAKYSEIEQYAEMWILPAQSDYMWYQKVQFYPRKAKITYYTAKDLEIGIWQTYGELESKLRPVSIMEYDTGIDILPIVEFTNLPKLVQGTKTTADAVPDCLPVFNLIKDVQDNIYYKRIERIINRTHFVGRKNTSPLGDNGNGDEELVQADALISSTVQQYAMTGTTGVGLVHAQQNYTEITIDSDYSMKMIFNGAGYEYDNFSGNNYTNKTESLMNNKLDIHTTLQKRSLRFPKLYRLFDYIFNHYKKWDSLDDNSQNNDNFRPYTLEFIDISIVNEITQSEVIDRQIKNGTITHVRAIHKQEKVTNKKARMMYEEIKKEQKEQLEQEMSYIDDNQTREEDIKGDIQ
ncbi:hypothetical protein [Spiroplasma citri]|uniref:hypothetical protein n=2 Tax=Spiroplasma citri TaxID=2133 RepID=UPI0011BB2D68|nr:hypothetical protein [Spiroplasma citri]QED24379.1 hypothetical protein FRX96_02605 [Spiroplasma citri]